MAIKISGAILEKSEEYFTYLAPIFYALNDFQKNYNWLISDIECYPHNNENKKKFSNEFYWLSGKELTDVIKSENFQWIWGVLSGFDTTISQAEVLSYDIPYADGYTGFWKNPLTLQHPLADTEIVAWDSSLVLFISKQDQYVKQFREKFPLAIDLETYNS